MTRIEELSKLIITAKRAYYLTSKPIMGDYKFDTLVRELKELDPNNPALSLIGTDVVGGTKVNLRYTMFSTDKALSMEELNSYRNRTMGTKRYIISKKCDGLSLGLEYIEGVLVGAYTSGNGYVGSDVTNKAMNMTCIPKTLDQPYTGRVHGEAIMTDANFHLFNDILVSEGADTQANTRNSVSGLMNSLNLTRIQEKMALVDFRAFGVYDESDPTVDIYGSYENYEDQLIKAKQLGFTPVEYKVLGSLSEIDYDAYHNWILETEFKCDGTVIRIDSNVACRKLGEAKDYLRGAVALKFKPDGALTKVLGIEWSIGGTEITPVILIEQINLEGADINRVGGHSVKNLIELEAYPGNYIYVVRSGGVIPKGYHASKADA